MSDAPRKTADWRDLAGRVTALVESGRPAEAERLLDGLLDDHRTPAGIWTLAGMVALRHGDAEAAVARLERAAALDPDNPDASYNLGVALLQTQSRDQAARCFREALARRPGHVPAATNLAELLTRAGEYEEAIRACRQALEKAADAGRLWLALGEALRRAGDLDAADEALTEAVRLLPDDPDALNRLGILRKVQGRAGDALACYRRALAAAPGRPAIHNNLGLALLAQDRPAAALDAFDKALELRPDWPEGLVNRGAALARVGRRAEAEEAARQAVRSAPDSPAALASLAAMLSGGREPERLAEAERLARRALELDSDLAGAQDTLGIVLLKRGRDEAAILAGRTAVAMAPEEPAYAEHLADNLARLERLAEAAGVLEDALERCPANTVLQRQLGIVRLRQGRPSEALALLEARLGAEPRDQRAIAHRAVALECLGRVAQARELLGLDRFIRAVEFRDVAPFESLAAFNRALAADIRAHPTLQWEPVGLAARGGALTGELLDAPTEAIRGPQPAPGHRRVDRRAAAGSRAPVPGRRATRLPPEHLGHPGAGTGRDQRPHSRRVLAQRCLLSRPARRHG